MKRKISIALLIVMSLSLIEVKEVYAEAKETKSELFAKRKKKYKGYQKPRSKKILGIFKRKSDCGCPKH